MIMMNTMLNLKLEWVVLGECFNILLTQNALLLRRKEKKLRFCIYRIVGNFKGYIIKNFENGYAFLKILI